MIGSVGIPLGPNLNGSRLFSCRVLRKIPVHACITCSYSHIGHLYFLCFIFTDNSFTSFSKSSCFMGYCFLSCTRMASRPAVAMASFSVSFASRAVGVSGEADESVGESMPSSQSMETPRATAILYSSYVSGILSPVLYLESVCSLMFVCSARSF